MFDSTLLVHRIMPGIITLQCLWHDSLTYRYERVENVTALHLGDENVRLKHNVPKKALEAVLWTPEGMGEAGWLVCLNKGFSFDPMADDVTRWIPADDPSEALDLVVYTYRTN